MKVSLGNTWLKFGASVSTYLMATNAFAQTGGTLGTVATTVGSSVSSVPSLLSFASYAAGAGIGMNGVLKLRAHSENPGQTPISHGAGRLAAGAGLIALPWAISTTLATMGASSGADISSGYKGQGLSLTGGAGGP